jgi:hypothetical protein
MTTRERLLHRGDDPGNTIGEVLAMTQYDANDLGQRMKAQFDAAIKQDRSSRTKAMRLLADYERG